MYYDCEQTIAPCIAGCLRPLPWPAMGMYLDSDCAEACHAANCKSFDCLTNCTAGSGCNGNFTCPARSCTTPNVPDRCNGCSSQYDGYYGENPPMNAQCGCFRPQQ